MILLRAVAMLVGIEARGDEPDAVGLLAGHLQERVLDVGDAEVTRGLSSDGVGAGRPHLGVRPGLEQPSLHRAGEVQVLAALNRDDLLAPYISLILPFPRDLSTILGPAAVVNSDDDP